MAEPKTINGSQLLIMVGDGASPEVFAHPCLINSERGLNFSSELTTQAVPDCDNPDDPAWNRTDKDALGCTITGAGMLDLDSVEEFFDWYTGPETKNVKVKAGTTGGHTWTGAFHCTEFSITGSGRKGKATCSITLVADGPVPRTDNA